ncbi:hypothetical protein BV898_08667 [Hypsibius exemplaris]|uniref:Uncharacterized protein n=1 Tax=Hypsibius exemplaris TaxID=2072580 RepID=A0A1W0WQ05_HYPEX|nr:hypothetical protein BV898_08667 [Hypsibius exemplaris]
MKRGPSPTFTGFPKKNRPAGNPVTYGRWLASDVVTSRVPSHGGVYGAPSPLHEQNGQQSSYFAAERNAEQEGDSRFEMGFEALKRAVRGPKKPKATSNAGQCIQHFQDIKRRNEEYLGEDLQFLKAFMTKQKYVPVDSVSSARALVGVSEFRPNRQFHSPQRATSVVCDPREPSVTPKEVDLSAQSQTSSMKQFPSRPIMTEIPQPHPAVCPTIPRNGIVSTAQNPQKLSVTSMVGLSSQSQISSTNQFPSRPMMTNAQKPRPTFHHTVPRIGVLDTRTESSSAIRHSTQPLPPVQKPVVFSSILPANYLGSSMRSTETGEGRTILLGRGGSGSTVAVGMNLSERRQNQFARPLLPKRPSKSKIKPPTVPGSAGQLKFGSSSVNGRKNSKAKPAPVVTLADLANDDEFAFNPKFADVLRQLPELRHQVIPANALPCPPSVLPFPQSAFPAAAEPQVIPEKQLNPCPASAFTMQFISSQQQQQKNRPVSPMSVDEDAFASCSPFDGNALFRLDF